MQKRKKEKKIDQAIHVFIFDSAAQSQIFEVSKRILIPLSLLLKQPKLFGIKIDTSRFDQNFIGQFPLTFLKYST